MPTLSIILQTQFSDNFMPDCLLFRLNNQTNSRTIQKLSILVINKFKKYEYFLRNKLIIVINQLRRQTFITNPDGKIRKSTKRIIDQIVPFEKLSRKSRGKHLQFFVPKNGNDK